MTIRNSQTACNMDHPSDSGPQQWLDLSEELMRFLRERDLIAAPDKHIWLFKANALDQLAAFLQKKIHHRCPDFELQGDPTIK